MENRKKALVTGSDGFIGSHLVDILLEDGVQVYAGVYGEMTKNLDHARGKIEIVELDVTNKKAVYDAVDRIKPDFIFHLAAQAYVMPSWQNIEKTFETNILGTLYILDAARNTGINPAIVVACSSAEYGLTHENEIPIKEDKEFRPSSPYAISKIGADMLCHLYARTYGMRIIRARFFNTVGPRKIGNAVADFAKMIADVEQGKSSKVAVGNLEGIVDLTDGRDAVKALWLLAKIGKYGEAYNICTGKGYKLKDVLDQLALLANKRVEIYQDSKKFRPLEDPVFIGDNSKIRKLGWSPEIKIEKTLEDTLNYWRSYTRNS